MGTIDIKNSKLKNLNRLCHSQSNAATFLYKSFSIKGCIEVQEIESLTSAENEGKRLHGHGLERKDIVKRIKN